MKGACLMMGGALIASLRSGPAATRHRLGGLMFAGRDRRILGVAAGEALGACCATHIVAATFG